MNEKLPAPCEPCHGSGLRDGSECSECRGKGYRLFVNGNQTPVRQDTPQRRQRQRPVQRQQHPVRWGSCSLARNTPSGDPQLSNLFLSAYGLPTRGRTQLGSGLNAIRPIAFLSQLEMAIA